MLRTIRLAGLVLAVAALGACSETKIFTMAPETPTQADTATKITLPAFSSNPSYQIAPNQANEWSSQVSFYAPVGFSPDYITESSNPAVAFVTTTTLTRSQEPTVNGLPGRLIYTIYVNFKVVGVGKSTITLTLKNAGNQKSSMFLEGVTPPTVPKG